MARNLTEGQILEDFEAALRYHKGWTQDDRDLARAVVTEWGARPVHYPENATWMDIAVWYAPPSGAYVAGAPLKAEDRTNGWINPPANDVYLYPGRLVLDANSTQWKREVPLSQHQTHSPASHHTKGEPPVCPACHLAHAGECP